MCAALSLSCYTSNTLNTVCKESTTIFLGYNLQCNTRIVYSLWVPHFSENNVVVSYFVPFHVAQKPWNGLIIRLQAPKSFDPCRRNLYQALEMIGGNPRIRTMANSLDHMLCLELNGTDTNGRSLFIVTFLHVGIKVVRIVAQVICRHLEKYGTPTWRLKFPAKFVTSCENALFIRWINHTLKDFNIIF